MSFLFTPHSLSPKTSCDAVHFKRHSVNGRKKGKDGSRGAEGTGTEGEEQAGMLSVVSRAPGEGALWAKCKGFGVRECLKLLRWEPDAAETITYQPKIRAPL